tara:strand:+ start:208 stop:1155 length:948 start_codon:yes stop_codon:yes gene_type:complete
MEVYKSLKDFSPLAKSVITIGSYDGLHRGHFQIINRVQTIAESINTDSVVITFDPHPRHVIKSDDKNIKLIMGMQKKTEIIRALKIDKLIILDFSDSFRKISADDFMSDIIIKYFNPKYIVAGFNHTFGYNRKGDSNFLSDYCQRKEIGLEIVRPLKDSDVIISSTNIRRLIINGFIRRANFELGSIFGFSAKVVHGSGRGKGLEFPTANLVPLEKRQLLPKKGVYFTRCIINGLNHYGMCNFGTRPTFGEDDLVLEVHLLNDYSKDFYNDIVWIEFLERIRSEVKFSSVNELTEQLYKDKNKSLILKDKYELGG